MDYFGNLIKRLLTISLVVITIYLSNYSTLGGNKGIYIPSDIDLQAMRSEPFSKHY